MGLRSNEYGGSYRVPILAWPKKAVEEQRGYGNVGAEAGCHAEEVVALPAL